MRNDHRGLKKILESVNKVELLIDEGARDYFVIASLDFYLGNMTTQQWNFRFAEMLHR